MTKYGQVPMMTINGEEIFQSPAMLRYVARSFGDGSLYPSDPKQMLEVESLLGLSDDIARAWQPCIYINMYPERFGHPSDMSPEAKAEIVKTLRERFVAQDMPRFMGYISDHLQETGAFLCGDEPTIADLQLLPQLRYFQSGTAEHVPVNCLEAYPEVGQWMERMYSIPAIKSWYDSKKDH